MRARGWRATRRSATPTATAAPTPASVRAAPCRAAVLPPCERRAAARHLALSSAAAAGPCHRAQQPVLSCSAARPGVAAAALERAGGLRPTGGSGAGSSAGLASPAPGLAGALIAFLMAPAMLTGRLKMMGRLQTALRALGPAAPGSGPARAAAQSSVRRPRTPRRFCVREAAGRA